jgi:hypothetical protein
VMGSVASRRENKINVFFFSSIYKNILIEFKVLTSLNFL